MSKNTSIINRIVRRARKLRRAMVQIYSHSKRFAPLLITPLVLCSSMFMQAQSAPTGPPKDLIVDLDLRGLACKGLTVSQGRYRIRLRNGVFTSNIQVKLDDALGNPEAATPAAKNAVKEVLLVVLRPGQHKLHVVGQPNWFCDITVTQ